MEDAEEWVGFGVEQGTNRKVRIDGTSADDVRMQAMGRAFTVKLHTIGKVQKAEKK